MAYYGAEYLQRLRAAVDELETAFDAWMVTQVESDHVQSRGLYPTVWTRAGEDQAYVRQLEMAVAEKAGAAAGAVPVMGPISMCRVSGQSTRSRTGR